LTGPTLGPAGLEALIAAAAAVGLPKLGIVRVDHVGFEASRAAFDRFLARGFDGEMDFMRTGADTRKHPEWMLEGARSIVVAAAPYRGDDNAVARYAQSRDYHTEVHERLEHVELTLREHAPGSRNLVCVDTRPIFERAAAALAGLGFIGKHGCLIVPGLGSWFVLGAVLTTAAWSGPDAVGEAPAALDAARWQACGACTKCLDACPTSAFVGPGDLDARRCIAYLTIEHRGAIDDALADGMGDRLVGCDVCQQVCPYNAAPGREARIPAAAWLPPPPGGVRVADPWRLVDIGNAPYRAWARHTAVRRVTRRSMHRNALIALGNAAGPLTAEQRARVQALAAGTDAPIAAAARRVLERRGGVD